MLVGVPDEVVGLSGGAAKRVRRGRHQRGRRWLLVVAPLLAIFLVASGALFVWPAHDEPQRADGLLSLDGPGEQVRERTAISLVERGYAPVLLFSQGAYRSTPCPTVPHVRVVCFLPVPGRTVGEVEFAARYARQHGWHSLIVVAGHEQTTRAKLLMGRCFSGRIIVVAAPVRWLQLPYDVVYEWGALLRAVLFNRSC